MSPQEQSEKVTRAMAVFAHPDEAEFGCGGTVARWVAEGIEFVYVVATDGSKGSADPEMSSDRLTFPELLADGLEPYAVGEVYVMGSDAPDTWIDITETLDRKIEALHQHASQIHSPETFERVRTRARETAKGHDMEYAECFKKFTLA
jgi:LmbE family N-acetylglucosaminyl deacetylase